MFDRFLRSLLVYSIVPLSEHSVVERASARVFRELIQGSQLTQLTAQLSLGTALNAFLTSSLLLLGLVGPALFVAIL